MKKLYLSLVIIILLIGIVGIVYAIGLLPNSDATIQLDKNIECQTKFMIDNHEYTLHFKPGSEVKSSRDTALKNNLEQEIFRNKIEIEGITQIDITPTICDGVETLGEGKISLEIIT